MLYFTIIYFFLFSLIRFFFSPVGTFSPKEHREARSTTTCCPPHGLYRHPNQCTQSAVCSHYCSSSSTTMRAGLQNTTVLYWRWLTRQISCPSCLGTPSTMDLLCSIVFSGSKASGWSWITARPRRWWWPEGVGSSCLPRPCVLLVETAMKTNIRRISSMTTLL